MEKRCDLRGMNTTVCSNLFLHLTGVDLKVRRVKDVVSLQDSYNRDKACLIMVSFSLLAGQFAEADIAKSLLHMISNDIGQVR